MASRTPGRQADFVDVLRALQRVDLDTWLSAMPDSVVQNAQRSVVVGEMLADISLPDGFDVSALTSSTELKDRYQLGAEVTGAVGCAWVDQWTRARAEGDTLAAQAAVDAMAASHEWSILEEMSDEGGWPQVFWIVADGLAADGIVDGGLTVGEFSLDAIGCG
ncbi:MAG: hypothetical protein R2707_16210 [Acidimicrobiales bacterium]